MSIRTKIATGFSVVLLVNLSAGVYGWLALKSAATKEAEVYQHTSDVVGTSLSAQVHFKKQVQEWKNVLIRGQEPELYEKYLNQFFEEERLTSAAIESLIPLLDRHPKAKQTAKQFLASHILLGEKYRDALVLYRANESQPHVAVDKHVRGIDRQPTDLLDEVVVAAQAYKERVLSEIWSNTSALEKRILAFLIAGMSLAVIILLWLIDRSIVRPIGDATAMAQRISRGDLTGGIHIKSKDEAAQLLSALDSMQRNLATYQQSLEESEEKTRLLLNSSGEGIYGVDAQGRCTFCNPAGLRMLGYEHQGHILENDMHNLMHHSHEDGSPFPVADCKASRTYRSGVPAYADDEVFWRADGSSFPVEYRSQPVFHEGELVGAVVTFADISQRRQAEQALHEAHRALASEQAHLSERVRERTAELGLANTELARIARAKDEFLASMSHELRTPLTSILGLSESLANQLYGPSNEQQTRAAKTIQESGSHLLSLINDILDVAKAESGKMQLVWDNVPVEQLCDASLRLVRQSAQRKELHIKTNIDPRIRLIRGDARRLKQLLVNLLSNAVKFTPEEGTIGLDVSLDEQQQRVCLGVWDTGIGIPEDRYDKLFKPFVQLDSKLSRQYSGTGLGLVLAYRMAELHGGSISVNSRVGRGSRFSVYLPWDPNAQAVEGAETSKEELTSPVRVKRRGRTPRILLAEDNDSIADMLGSFLRTKAYDIRIARNGVEAVTAAVDMRPDVILMDIQMPEMDGLEATRRLRTEEQFDRTPIIALTALAMPGDRERCLEAGADDYLSKPVGLKELESCIESWFGRVAKTDD